MTQEAASPDEGELLEDYQCPICLQVPTPFITSMNFVTSCNVILDSLWLSLHSVCLWTTIVRLLWFAGAEQPRGAHVRTQILLGMPDCALRNS